jgi:hypothetical protein
MASPKPTVAETLWVVVLKIFVAIILAGLVWWLSIHIETSYQVPAEPSAAQEMPGIEKAIPDMKETGDLLINWTIVLFGGTIGIAILAKGPKIRDRNWSLVLIPSTWVLIYHSLFHGTEFKEKLTYQTGTGKYLFSELNMDLYLQQLFFRYSLFALGVLATFFLLFRFAMLEERTKNGEEE